MYYRLTYKSNALKERVGDRLLNGSRPLHIGQGNACELQLPPSEKYEPQVYASILPHESGEGWYLVRRTDAFRVLVNETEVGVARTLHHGDRLTFADDTQRTQLLFEVCRDGDYDAASGFVYQRRKSHKAYLLAALAVALPAIGFGLYALQHSPSKDLRHEDLSPLTSSIYHITADSVFLLCDTVVEGRTEQRVVEAIELEKAAEGTAFLTADSLFVTARHCVEPWINDEEWDGVSARTNMSPEVRLATMAETANRLSGEERYHVRAHCILSKGLEQYDHYSSDFFMNKTRDLVLKLGTEEEVIYWRTIFPIARRRDMELGDFAYLKATRLPADKAPSVITLAGEEDMEAFGRSRNHDLAVIGYPLNDNETDEASVVYGDLMEFGEEFHRQEGCIRISAPINPGNSGGPVLARIGDEIKIIGIVSKADGRANQGMFWAVPVTEVVRMHRQGDRIEEETVTYRR